MLVKTMKVKSKEHKDLPFVIINEEDYNEEIHTKIIETNEEPAPSDNQTVTGEVLSKDDPEHQSLARYSNPKNKKGTAPDPADHQQG